MGFYKNSHSIINTYAYPYLHMPFLSIWNEVVTLLVRLSLGTAVWDAEKEERALTLYLLYFCPAFEI